MTDLLLSHLALPKDPPLNLVYPPVHALREVAPYRVNVTTRLIDGAFLEARFEVRSEVSPYANDTLNRHHSQWGLWEWDVVELFVSCSNDPSNCPYFEFQVSPLNQFLELKVVKPRVEVDHSFQSGFQHQVQRLERGNWNAQMRIPVSSLGWDHRPESIVGNAFAVLGEGPMRTYWSRYLDAQAKPDFHLPQAFMRLVD